MLSSKVERQEVLSYLENKSNIKDTEDSMRAIDVLHKQIKHLCVILVEIMRQEVARFTTGGGADASKQKNTALATLKQTLSIAKWINKFNPERELVNSDLVLPKYLQNFQDLVNNTLNDITELALTKEHEFEKKKSNFQN
jgi:hypothetical protein